MSGYLLLFAVAAVVSALLTPLCIRIAPRIGIMDLPNSLSIHRKAMPRAGGVAMFAAVLTAGVLALFGLVPLTEAERIQLLGILVGTSIVAGVGFLDDIRRIAPEVKFCWEIVGAMVTLAYGVQIGTFPLIWIALPLTVLYLVGGANAVNLMDGMDGLAGGIGAIAALFLGALALIDGNSLAAVMCALTLGSVLGFLPFNVRPAKTFMGDCGSLQLGFLLTASVVLISSKPYDLVWSLAPLTVLALPILDTSAALLRRRMAKGDMFSGDRCHIYDLVMNREAGYWRTVASLWTVAVGMGIVGALASLLAPTAGLAIIAFGCIASVVGAWRLGAFAPEAPEPAHPKDVAAEVGTLGYVQGREFVAER